MARVDGNRKSEVALSEASPTAMLGAEEKPATAAAAATAAARTEPAWRYLPEVDWLRTIAVLSVFCFHLDRNLLPGGFVGVDIFFVISGFLISSVLLQDIDLRTFSILRFYQHRIARIAPALFLILALSLVPGIKAE